MMALAVIAATAVLLPLVWLLGDKVVGWGERRWAARKR